MLLVWTEAPCRCKLTMGGQVGWPVQWTHHKTTLRCEILLSLKFIYASYFSGGVKYISQRHHEATNVQNIVLIARSQVGHRENLPLSVETGYESFTSLTHLRISPYALHSSFLCLSNKVNARVKLCIDENHIKDGNQVNLCIDENQDGSRLTSCSCRRKQWILSIKSEGEKRLSQCKLFTCCKGWELGHIYSFSMSTSDFR